jgi:hypothetical protein
VISVTTAGNPDVSLIKLLQAANTVLLSFTGSGSDLRKISGNPEIPAGDGDLTVTFLTVYGENGSRTGIFNKDIDLGFRELTHHSAEWIITPPPRPLLLHKSKASPPLYLHSASLP